MPSPRRAAPRRGAALAVLLIVLARPAGAADVDVTLPVVTASRGATVQIPIELAPDLSGLGVESIQYTLPLDPAVVSGASALAEGLVWYWGAPFTHITSTAVSVVAVGVSPIASTETRLHTLELTVSPTATIGADMPLTLSLIRFNEGAPSAQVTPGVLQVRTASTGIERRAPAGLSLLSPSPNPVRSVARLAFSLPPGAVRARLTVFGLDGRRVRTLFDGTAEAGPHEATWDARDQTGRRVPAGVYLCALECGGRRAARRVVVLD